MIPTNAYLQNKINSALILFHLSIHKTEKDFVKSASTIFVENRNIWKYTSQNCAWGNTSYWIPIIVYRQFQQNLENNTWNKVFKNEPSKICGRKPLKKFEGIWST